jgi:putative ABC transport system permease protein
MEALRHRLGILWQERSRVGLVVLGVIWGTLSLTLLLAFGSAFDESTTHTLNSFGPGLLRVGHGATTMPYRGMAAGRRTRPTPENADAIAAAVPGVDGVAIEYVSGFGNIIEHDGERLNVSLVGCSPSFGELRNQWPQPGGRFLNERDEREHRRVIFLGHRTKERLFGKRDAVGATVDLLGTAFTVVGVQVPKITVSNYSGEDRDKVMIPAATFRELYGWRWVSCIWVRFQDSGERQRVIDDVRAVMGRLHGVHPQDAGAIWTMDYVEIEEMVDLVVDGNRVFTLLVGAIGLLVAIVGVANVTYALVEERTREIGVQMALGARPRDLALEPLTESVVVTLLGGLLGIAACALLLWALSFVDLPPDVRAYVGHPHVSLPLGGLVVLILMISGGLAGWIPARRAATMNPVEALREE